MGIAFPGFDNLFWMHNPLASRPYAGTFTVAERKFAEDAHESSGEERIGLFARSLLSPLEPFKVRRIHGARQPSHVVWIDVFSLAVSSHVLEVLRTFSGWSTFPIEIQDCATCDHQGFAVWGRSGPTTMDTSNVVGEGVASEYLGMKIDPDGWDGSHIFLPSRGWGPLVTGDVRRAFVNAKIRNVRFTRMDQFRYFKGLRDRHPPEVLIDPNLGPEFYDPLRSRMFVLQSDEELTPCGLASGPLIGRIPGGVNPRRLKAGVRAVLSDGERHVDAIVQELLSDGKCMVGPITRGHGSLGFQRGL